LILTNFPIFVINLCAQSFELFGVFRFAAWLFIDLVELLSLLLELANFILDKIYILVLPMELHEDGLERIEFLRVLLMQFLELELVVGLILLDSLLKGLHLSVIAGLHIFKRLD
jgi:hypothetical protein